MPQLQQMEPDEATEALPPRRSFSQTLPKLQIAFDSTSLGELKLCPRRYQYTIVEGYQPPDESVHLRFGIEYHAALELYDVLRAEGTPHEAALHAAVRSALIATWDTTLNRPWTSDDPNKNRETLIRSIIDYLDYFGQDDSLKTVILANGQAAVELSFRLELPIKSRSGEQFLLCGHIDRLVEFLNRLWVSDRKTTKNTINTAYFARFTPDNQISLYSYAGRILLGAAFESVRGVIIDAAQILVNTTTFQRSEVERSEPQLEEWISDTQHYIGLAELYAERNYWPQNDKACGGTYLDPVTHEIQYGCPFRPVCSAQPSIRDTLLKLNYKRRVWDPLVPRGSGARQRASLQLQLEAS